MDFALVKEKRAMQVYLFYGRFVAHELSAYEPDAWLW